MFMDDPAEAKLQPTRQRSLANRHRFVFIDDGADAVVAIFQRPLDGTVKLAGTGFFVAKGVVATARHLFTEHVRDGDEFEVLQKRAQEIAVRQLALLVYEDSLDVAICKLAAPTAGAENWDSHPVVGLMSLDPLVNEPVGSFAVSHTLVGSPREVPDGDGQALAQPVRFQSHWELGHMEELHPEGVTFLPGRVFQTSIFVEGRGSGGPVFNSNGFVVGVNCRGAAQPDGLPYSYSLSIRHVLSLVLDGRTIREHRKALGSINRIAVFEPNRSGQ